MENERYLASCKLAELQHMFPPCATPPCAHLNLPPPANNQNLTCSIVFKLFIIASGSQLAFVVAVKIEGLRPPKCIRTKVFAFLFPVLQGLLCAPCRPVLASNAIRMTSKSRTATLRQPPIGVRCCRENSVIFHGRLHSIPFFTGDYIPFQYYHSV